MSFKPLVLIPSYNTGADLLRRTLLDALQACDAPALVVIDGSSDGSEREAQELAERFPERLRVLLKPRNEGKGAAVRSGLLHVKNEGFSHALVMDADGQHPADRIDDFFAAARKAPEAMILGQPVFDASVPLERLHGRKLSVWLVQFEVAGRAIGDPLFGFRVYPVEPLLRVMEPKGRSNRYDFDPEVAVRLNWLGVPSVKIDARVNYLDKSSGGVSHFHYVRDNIRFVRLHTRLALEAPFRWMTRGKTAPHLATAEGKVL